MGESAAEVRKISTMAVNEQKEEDEAALVPLLCVYKNGTFLHSILLYDVDLEEEKQRNNEEFLAEEILMVGRHPDCHIVVDHPSISRWHLQIQLHKSSQEILLTDLNSIHGTFVCGQRVTPKVPVTLGHNDTFRMGASTRVYKLEWLPYPTEEDENCPTPKCLDDVFVPNKQHCAFDGDNKEQALKEKGYVEAVQSDSRDPTPISSGIVSELKEHEYGSNDVNNKKASNEEGDVEAVESVLRNQMETPIFMVTVSETNKQECAFGGENKEQALKVQGYAESVQLLPILPNPVLSDIVSEPKKQECEFDNENREQGQAESIQPVPCNAAPKCLDDVFEPNKQDCAFDGENEEQVMKELEEGYIEAVESDSTNSTPILSGIVSELKEHEYVSNEQASNEEGEHVEAVESVPRILTETPIFLVTVFEPNKQECAFAGEIKEQVLKEQVLAESVQLVSSNPTPVLSDIVSEPNKQDCEFDDENKEQRHTESIQPVPHNMECVFDDGNKEQASKEDGYVNAVDLTPIFFDIGLEEECGFDDENKEQASKDERYVKAVESHPGNQALILLDGAFEPHKQECRFVDKNKEQFLMEVEAVESSPWNPVQPSAPPLPESASSPEEKTFSVGTDARMTPVKENHSPTRDKNGGRSVPNLWSRRQKDVNLVCLRTGRMAMNLNAKKMKENQVKLTKQKGILKENANPQIFKESQVKLSKKKGILKENSSPQILKENHLECGKKNRVLGEKKRDSVLQVLQPETSAHGSSSTGFYPDNDESYPSDKENWTPKVSGQPSKENMRNFSRVGQEIHPQTDTGRVPFQSLSRNSRVNNRPPMSSSLKNTNKSSMSFSLNNTNKSMSSSLKNTNKSPMSFSLNNTNKTMENHQGLRSQGQFLGRVQQLNAADSKKKWYMVVDTGCLINKESRQALNQLEGIKGTNLIIPRIVIRELDCQKRQKKSKKGNEAQESLRWIEECMVNKGWWIHVQNSTECFSVGVTPPASPHSHLSDGSNGGSSSVAFSSYGSFADVLSPTAEDHILECSLLFKRLVSDGHVVLLSNDVALKIKAMAEGMLCENAKEFCQSLVSPYSERFLWSQSTPHGPNWIDVNSSSSRKCTSLGIMRKSTYLGITGKSLVRDEELKKKSNEGAKGLKLILLHNSHYGKKNV